MDLHSRLIRSHSLCDISISFGIEDPVVMWIDLIVHKMVRRLRAAHEPEHGGGVPHQLAHIRVPQVRGKTGCSRAANTPRTHSRSVLYFCLLFFTLLFCTLIFFTFLFFSFLFYSFVSFLLFSSLFVSLFTLLFFPNIFLSFIFLSLRFVSHLLFSLLHFSLLAASIVSELPPLAFSHASNMHHCAHIWVRL